MTEKDMEVQNLRRIVTELERAHQLNLAAIEERDRTIEALREEMTRLKTKTAELDLLNKLQQSNIVRLRRQMQALEEAGV